MQTYLVGGAVRDEIMGLRSKDLDYSVVLDDVDLSTSAESDPYLVMREILVAQGYHIYTENPEFLTIRAKAPNGDDADFVLARKEAGYADGRRPDTVIVGTLMDDLGRRDFCCNAIAKAADGTLIDPFGGIDDIQMGLIRCVGRAWDRIIVEDALRGLRAMRFSITKGFGIHWEIQDVLQSGEFKDALKSVSTERQREELEKMFAVSTVDTLELLIKFGLTDVLFNDTGLRLMPTMKG